MVVVELLHGLPAADHIKNLEETMVDLLQCMDAIGVVIEIERRPYPNMPLAMGNHYAHVTFRQARQLPQ